MTEAEFDNGYWYATEIKTFAQELGITAVSSLRKDELEKLIKGYLRTGRLKSPARRIDRRNEVRDVDRGLKLNLAVVNYTNDRATKDFLEREARRIDPGFKIKSGSRYRLNRWREEQIGKRRKITYLDLVRQYVRLSQTVGRFPQEATGRYVYFLSDFFAAEKNVTRADAIAAWNEVKQLDIPKTYRDWKKYRESED